ncbi:MAG TPA: phage holin family protein, partial [Thermoanaerobaculia bacterium]|nr:phage holin family protein [Thermoanaerobaculia bacterium]
MRGERGWTGRLREVGEAFLGVLRAELAAIAADLTASGKALLRALVLLAAAFGVAFWTLGLVLYFAIELLALVLPRWGAVGIVLAVFLGLSLLLLVAA